MRLTKSVDFKNNSPLLSPTPKSSTNQNNDCRMAIIIILEGTFDFLHNKIQLAICFFCLP